MHPCFDFVTIVEIRPDEIPRLQQTVAPGSVICGNGTDPAILEAAGIRISMDGRGRALDNIFTERLWRSVKYEEIYLNEYLTPREARQGLSRYFDFYNHQRPHQALDYATPAAVYFKPFYL